MPAGRRSTTERGWAIDGDEARQRNPFKRLTDGVVEGEVVNVERHIANLHEHRVDGREQFPRGGLRPDLRQAPEPLRHADLAGGIDLRGGTPGAVLACEIGRAWWRARD